MNKIVEEIEGLGATFVTVSPNRLDLSRELIENRRFEFPILRDPRNEVAALYGLRWQLPDDLRQLYLGWGVDLEAANGDPGWTLPMPARYIIDRDATVRYARFDPDYTLRPEPEETLEALRELVG